MARPTCPACGSMNVRVMELTPDLRAIKIKCGSCGAEAHIVYPVVPTES